MIENNILDVSKEIDDFFEDYKCSKKNLKLIFKFKSSDFSLETTEIKISNPKKRKVFRSKVKAYKKIDNSKGIF